MNGLETADAWLYVGLVIGHAALAVGFLNVLHGLGLSPKWMSRLAVAPLLIPGIAAIAMGWLMLTRRVDDWPTVPLVYAYACSLVSFVILPTLTLARYVRGNPTGVTGSRRVARLNAPEGGPLGWVGKGKYAWMLGLRGNQSLSLEVARWEVAVPELPEAFRPLRILHISDLHFAHCYARGYFEAVGAEASRWEADLVLFTGDLLDDETTLDWTGPVLGGLRGRLGQYAILGNHDVLHRPGRVRRALRSAGYTIIDGRWIQIDDGGCSIALGGTSVPWGPALDPSTKPASDATIVLSHSPDHFPTISRWGNVDLVLAGHNHGGQIRFPVLGPVVMPSVYGRRYDRGFYRSGRTLMEVTQGVGGKHPLRYGCPPEIVQLVLQPSTRTAEPARAGRRTLSRTR